MRATHGNKFIRHLSDDIVSENHHLKSEIIKIRKVLKNYEQVMVGQLVKLAKDQKLDQCDGFFFETPEQYFNHFVEMVTKNIHKNAQFQLKNRQYSVECEQLKLENAIKQNKIIELTQSLQMNLSKVLKLEATNNKLLEQLSEIRTISFANEKKLKAQVHELKEELGKKQTEYQIKFLEDKKILMDKTNKDLAKVKAEMEVEIIQKQKSIKYEHDKRDKQFKNLFSTINSFIARSESKQARPKMMMSNINLTASFNLGQVRKQSLTVEAVEESKPVGPTLSSQSIQLLKQAIKPFSEHSILLQKLADCRKENLQLRTQLRQLSTNLQKIKVELAEKSNEFSLQMMKHSALKIKHHEMHDELINVREELHANQQDKENMEKYYSERWNTEINKVKYNIEKKCETRLKNLDEEYKQLRSSLELERIELREETFRIAEECRILKQSNQALLQQNSKLRLQKAEFIKTIAIRDRLLMEIQAMHNEDLLSTKLMLADNRAHYLAIIQKNKESIIAKDIQILTMQQQFRENMTVLKENINNEIVKQVQQIQKLHNEEIHKKDHEIESLSRDIQSHRAIIVTYQMEQSNRAEATKIIFAKQKDKELRQVKVSHFEEVSKLNQKIHRLEERIKSLRQEMSDKMQENTKVLIEKQRDIKENKFKIAELEDKISMRWAEQKKIKESIQTLQSERASEKQQFESLLIEIKSVNLILAQREEQIAVLVHEKNTWLNNILQCKKQFEKGFKELKKINDNKVSHYQSRIWELERICGDGGISQKDYEKIRSLTEEKKKLKDEVAMKEAENLVLTQVKTYYENKSKDLDGKLMIKYVFKQEKKPIPILAKKPRRDSKLRNLKTDVREDIGDFTGCEAVEIKKYNQSARNASMKSQAELQSTFYRQFRANTRTNSRSKARVNSSLM